MTAVAAGLALRGIGDKSVWVDEGTSLWLAALDWSDFWHVITRREANSGLYYFLLRGWFGLGRSEAFVRSLSALFAVGTVPALFLLMRRLFGAPAALAGGLILVVNAFWVHYAQEARGYALAMLLVTLGTYFLVLTVEGEPRFIWLVYAFVMAAAMYAHFYAAFVVVAHAASLPLLAPRGIPFARIAGAFGVFVVLTAPLGAFVLTNDVGQVDWLNRPDAEALLVALEDVVGGAGRELLYVYGALALVAIGGLVAAWFTRRDAPERFWGFGVVLLWAIVPIAGGYLVSQVKPLFHPRFLIVSLPALAAVAALGIAGLRIKVLAVGALAGLLFFAAQGLPEWYDGAKQPWRDVTAYVAGNAEPGDRIVFFSPTIRRPVEYYVELDRLEERFPEALSPRGEWGSHPVRLSPYRPERGPINEGAGDAGTVWFAASNGGKRATQRVEAAIEAHCDERLGRWFGGKLRAFSDCG